MTVYPRNIKEALFLAEKLQLITEDYICPTVPFDNSFRGSRCIYYRYGSFSLNIKNEDGTLVSAIRDKNGNLVPDKRESGSAVPNWLEDPFLEKTQNIDVQKFPSDSYIRAYEAISQRGKGGVFLAIDLSYAPARKCILKEGRKNGEVEWDGKDGHWRIQHEAVVLDELAKKEIKVAELYSTFEAASNYYIVTEFIEGVTLQSILNKKLNIEDYLSYGYQISEIMYKIHEAGWVWRDCKPMNIIKSLEGCLRPIDFEGACRADASNEIPWGTPGYVPPEWLNDNISKVPEDLYALGVTLHQLISGHIPTTGQLKPLGKCRYNVPITIRNIVSQLLNPDPTKRPSAMSVLNIFENELSKAIETNKISMII
nr:protein kinase [Paenibacillus odorifer]